MLNRTIGPAAVLLALTMLGAVTTPTPARSLLCPPAGLWWSGSDGRAFDIERDGSLMFVAGDFDNGDTLRIYNGQDPTEPVLLGSLSGNADSIGELKLAGNTLYAVAQPSKDELQVIDVSDPTTPVLLGTHTEGSDPITDVDAIGSTLFLSVAVSSYSNDLRIYDASDPGHLVQLFSGSTPAIDEIELVDDSLLFASGCTTCTGDISVWDISDPANPVMISAFDSGLEEVWTMTVQDGYFLAAYSDFGGLVDGFVLSVIDVTLPLWPTGAGLLAHPITNNTEAASVAYSDGYAYVANRGAGIHIVDVSDTANPQFVRTLGGDAISSNGSVSLELYNNSIFAADHHQGMQVYDARDLAGTPLIAQFDTTGPTRHVIVEGSLAYVSEWGNGLRIYDISDPDLVVPLGFSDEDGLRAISIAKQDHYIYVANYWETIQVIDVSDPTNPTLVASRPTARNTFGIDVHGSTLIATCTMAKYAISYDVSDPTNPVELQRFRVGGGATDVDIHGSLAYLSDADGVIILDISDPAAMSVVGSVTTIGGVDELDVVGDMVYTIQDKLDVIDASDPANPVHVASADLGIILGGFDIKVIGDTAYAATTSGLVIVDLASIVDGQANIELHPTASSANNITIEGEQAYLALEDNSVLILDASDCSFCPADLNADGLINYADLTLFVDAFIAGDAPADLNADLLINYADILAFIDHFTAGC